MVLMMKTGSTTTIAIPTSDEFSLRADLYLPDGGRPVGIVILCHGFKGYKTWGFFPYLAASLRDAGLAALSIDLSHNGTFPKTAEGESQALGDAGEYLRPDLFERNTLKREYDDLGCAIRYVAEGHLTKWIKDPVPIGLYGHSRGGVVAILNAIDRPEVTALCTWSTIDDPDFFSAAQKERWREAGKYEFVEAGGGRPLSVGLAYLDDLEENHQFYLLRDRVKELRIPHLIIHGRMDLVVKVDSALVLHEAERNITHRRLVMLHAGHTFGAPYPEPFDPGRPAKVLQEAVGETVDWFEKYLNGGFTT